MPPIYKTIKNKLGIASRVILTASLKASWIKTKGICVFGIRTVTNTRPNVPNNPASSAPNKRATRFHRNLRVNNKSGSRWYSAWPVAHEAILTAAAKSFGRTSFWLESVPNHAYQWMLTLAMAEPQYEPNRTLPGRCWLCQGKQGMRPAKQFANSPSELQYRPSSWSRQKNKKWHR